MRQRQMPNLGKLAAKMRQQPGRISTFGVAMVDVSIAERDEYAAALELGQKAVEALKLRDRIKQLAFTDPMKNDFEIKVLTAEMNEMIAAVLAEAEAE